VAQQQNCTCIQYYQTRSPNEEVCTPAIKQLSCDFDLLILNQLHQLHVSEETSAPKLTVFCYADCFSSRHSNTEQWVWPARAAESRTVRSAAASSSCLTQPHAVYTQSSPHEEPARPRDSLLSLARDEEHHSPGSQSHIHSHATYSILFNFLNKTKSNKASESPRKFEGLLQQTYAC